MMKIPQGMLFLQVSGTVLLLVATALYQNRTALILEQPSLQERQDIYQRYDTVRQLLETNHPVAAAELLASFPEEVLAVNNALLRDRFATCSPAVLYLRIGKLLSDKAKIAARNGSEQQARLLVGSCALLRRRLEGGGNHRESYEEQVQRLQLTRLLERYIQRTEGAITLYKIS